MVSQVHTITNKSRLADGPVRGLPGYNPFLQMIDKAIPHGIHFFPE